MRRLRGEGTLEPNVLEPNVGVSTSFVRVWGFDMRRLGSPVSVFFLVQVINIFKSMVGQEALGLA